MSGLQVEGVPEVLVYVAAPGVVGLSFDFGAGVFLTTDEAKKVAKRLMQIIRTMEK